MSAYYNEIDPYAAQWLRNLIQAGHIAPGVVDERSIADVKPEEIEGFTQCHFFAGIGVWSYALRLAEWPDDKPIWTGSCPCQPFSGAGKRGGFADERHLWPAWFDLIRERRPGVCIGEQVASPDGLGWWDSVQDHLENADYASAAFDLCVPGVGGPHIRQRLYWMAHAGTAGLSNGKSAELSGSQQFEKGRAAQQCGCSPGGLAYADIQDQGGRGIQGSRQGDGACDGAACERFEGFRATGGLANFDGRNACAEREQRSRKHGQQPQDSDASDTGIRPSPLDGFWRAADWLFCRDGKWRPVEPGTFPLAHGTANRVGRLRAYGNAIVAPQAAEFIKAVMDVCNG